LWDKVQNTRQTPWLQSPNTNISQIDRCPTAKLLTFRLLIHIPCFSAKTEEGRTIYEDVYFTSTSCFILQTINENQPEVVQRFVYEEVMECNPVSLTNERVGVGECLK
jgi:hypothetical protein